MADTLYRYATWVFEGENGPFPVACFTPEAAHATAKHAVATGYHSATVTERIGNTDAFRDIQTYEEV